MEDEIDIAVSSLDREIGSQHQVTRNGDNDSANCASVDASNTPDVIMKRLYRASPESLVVRDVVKSENGQNENSVNNLDEFYEELDEHDITEIYLGKSETDSAVAALEMSNEMNEIVIQPLKEEVSSVKSEFPDSSNDANEISDTDSSKQETKEERKDIQTFESKINCKRRPSDVDIENDYRNKRIKLEITEEIDTSSLTSKPEHDFKMPPLTKPGNDNFLESTISSSSNQRPASSIDLCPPVAIVSPMGIKEDSDTVSFKHETSNDKEYVDLKMDINSILESFEKDDVPSATERPVKTEQPSIKLTDSEFEQFKNDILTDNSFKTLNGGQWIFGNSPQKQYGIDNSRRSSVESDIGDFEKVLSSFIKRSDSIENGKVNHEITNTNIKPPSKNPYLIQSAKNADKIEPNVILANSELLRELLEDKPDKDNCKNRVKPGSVDLSFLDRDLQALKGSRTPVAALLKTKNIEPTFKSGPKMNESSLDLPDSSVPGRGFSDVCITIPDEEVSTRDNKNEDPGPLSLAEQRRASVTLHHKVPSLTDLMNASGPLNKMNGDETEALLNELVGSPGNDHYRNDFTSPASHIAPPDYKSGYPPSVGAPPSGFNGSYHGNGQHPGTGNHPLMSSQVFGPPDPKKQFPGVPQGMPDFSGVDLDSLPPERRQILLSRYGHLFRRRGMVDPLSDRHGHTDPQHQSLLTPVSMAPYQNTSGLPPEMRGPMPMKNAMVQRQNTIVPYDQLQNKDSLAALMSTNNESNIHRDNPGSSVSGAMDDRMRHLMMQQLHRRRMMSQMQNQLPYQSQTEVSHPQTNNKQMSSMHPNSMMRPDGGSPHDMHHLPHRFSGQSMQHGGSAGQGYPYRPGMEGHGHQYMPGPAGPGYPGRPRMFHHPQGHPAYTRQQGQMSARHVQPSRTPPQTGIAHAQSSMAHAHAMAPQLNGQASSHQSRGQYRPMSPLSQGSYPQPSQSHDAIYSRPYQSPDSTFKEPNMNQNGALGSTGVLPVSVGMSSYGKEQQNFAPRSSDFFT